MKNLLKFIPTIGILALTSCRGCYADYQERQAALKKICPTCILTRGPQGRYYAADTSVNPNIIYIVYFKPGGIYYKASDIDDLEVIK